MNEDIQRILQENGVDKISFYIINSPLINNAFTMGTLAKIDKLDNTEIQNSINVNLVSSVLLIKSFINKL